MHALMLTVRDAFANPWNCTNDGQSQTMARMLSLADRFDLGPDLRTDLVSDTASNDFQLPRTLRCEPPSHRRPVDDRLRVWRRRLAGRVVGEVPEAMIVHGLVLDDLRFEFLCLQRGIEQLIADRRQLYGREREVRNAVIAPRQ